MQTETTDDKRGRITSHNNIKKQEARGEGQHPTTMQNNNPQQCQATAHGELIDKGDEGGWPKLVTDNADLCAGEVVNRQILKREQKMVQQGMERIVK